MLDPALAYIGGMGWLALLYDPGPWLRGLLPLSSDDSLEPPSEGLTPGT